MYAIVSHYTVLRTADASSSMRPPWPWHQLDKLYIHGQELRGGRLDHEHHDMSEKHEPAGAAIYPAIPRLAGDIASGRT
jgi:hypothetical protein